MATIRKRGQRWQVQVRRKGFPDRSRSFLVRADAVAWARQMEAQADRRGLPVDPKALECLTVSEVVERYRDSVVVTKKGRDVETAILNAFIRTNLARMRLSEINPAHFASYRDERLQRVKPVTINRELGILRHAFNIARQEWNIPLGENPGCIRQAAHSRQGKGSSAETG